MWYRDGPIEKVRDEKGKLRAFTLGKSGKKNEETLIDDVMSTDSAEELLSFLFSVRLRSFLSILSP